MNKNIDIIESDNEIEIDLGAIFFELRKRLWVIILVSVLFAVSALIIGAFFIDPVYKSTTKVYVLSKQGADSPVTYSDLQLATQLTSDYEQLIKSRYVMESVCKELKLEYSAVQLASMMTVSSPPGTRILEIAVRNEDPVLAQKIADATREIASQQIVQIMNIDAVNVVDIANLPDGPTSPNVRNMTAIGGLLGLALACVAVILAYIFNDTIKISEDIEKYLGLSVLGTIPSSEARQKNKKRRREKHR